MATIIAREFSFSKDFRSIKWGPTLQYNLLRAACAGLVLGVLMFLFPHSQADRNIAPAGPLIWMFGYLIFFLPFGLLLSLLSQFVPFIWLFSLFFALVTVTVGDPIVCFLKILVPKLVPVDAPPLFSTNMVIFVIAVPEVTVINQLINVDPNKNLEVVSPSSTNKSPLATTTAKYDQAKWSALLKYDSDIASIADKIRPFGQKWLDEFASSYLALNDKQYLPEIEHKITIAATR